MISFSGCVKYVKSFFMNCFACHLCCENIRAHGKRKSVHHILHIVPINRPSQLMAIEVIRGCKQTPAHSLTCINTSICDVSVPDLNQANRLCTLEHMCSLEKKSLVQSGLADSTDSNHPS